ncbi:MAG: M20/M25/M40 family metallo-hydrolase [Gemmatimonadetes bacterium]|nr:M20/M25/M40 family metallo-hydrolase [Gemmatimonadota bacterium]
MRQRLERLATVVVCVAAWLALQLMAGRGAAVAQEVYATRFSPELVRRPAVRDAVAWLEQNFERQQLPEWIRIAEIPAPPGKEEIRGAYVRQELEREGLRVSVDSIGNVIARRPGKGNGPTVVFAAHLDTVHPVDTDHSVRRDGQILRAPGVSDNTVSVANMLAVVRALNRAKIETRGDLIFIATVQEEAGLRGMIYWIERNAGIADMLIAVDGGGLGSVSYGALGILWTRYGFRGPGSHTNSSAGKPHPARALADAIRSIYEIRIPEGRGGAVYNVGMIGGGKVFNAIPEEAYFTVDLRSVNPVLLDSLNAEIESRVSQAAAAHRVQWTKEVVNREPAGGTEEMLRERRTHPVVQTAVDVYRFLGFDSGARATGSSDAGAAVVRGIPAISVGGARGGDAHTLAEWADGPSALTGTKAFLLMAVALAELE